MTGISELQASVIVPVHRHWNILPVLLEALAAQTLAQDRFEVLIVNNDAPVSPPLMALPQNARILPCEAPGSYAARNAGAGEARGAWLVFTDADCRPAPDWLAALTAALPESLRAGPVEMALPQVPNAFAIYDLVRGIPQARYVAHGYATTANLAVPRWIFEAQGGFDASRRSGGDAEFCRRPGIRKYGLRLVPEAVVAHPCRTRWEDLALKARRVKGGQVRAGSLSRRISWTLRSLVPPFRDTVYYLASPHPVRFRLTAVAVRFRLWGVELAEVVRLVASGAVERR
jgi:glycosyltransferase involved in cell wall biosynthesis